VNGKCCHSIFLGSLTHWGHTFLYFPSYLQSPFPPPPSLPNFILECHSLCLSPFAHQHRPVRCVWNPRSTWSSCVLIWQRSCPCLIWQRSCPCLICTRSRSYDRSYWTMPLWWNSNHKLVFQHKCVLILNHHCHPLNIFTCRDWYHFCWLKNLVW